MSSWSEERRLNSAAEREQQRKDDDARAERIARQRQIEDERRRQNRLADKAEARAEQLQRRKDRANRRKERAATWASITEPANAYGRGTTALVTASVLASLPAQFIHFVAISPMMLTVPIAIEGGAWVAFAGVRYADAKGLPGWVRWILRVLTVTAAGYAAHINYEYGASIAPAAAWGLAGVTLGGPMFAEIRQWVMAMSTATRSGAGRKEAKARRKHDKQRRSDWKDVQRIADRLISAAPFGTLSEEDAFSQAWFIVNGTHKRGVTASLEQMATASRARMAKAVAGPDATPEADAIDRFLEDVFGPGWGDDGNPGGATAGAPHGDPDGGGDSNARRLPRGTSQGRTALGGKGKRGIRGRATKAPLKPLDEADLDAVRRLADGLGDAAKLSVSNVKTAVGGGRNEYLIRLRDAVRAEREN
ncbi:hypothetical protein ABZ312_11510 [Streptomyces sp. NPDC006207]